MQADEEFWFKIIDDIDMLMSLKPAELRVYLVVSQAIQRDKNAGKLSVRQVAARAKVNPKHAFRALEDHVAVGRLLREGKPGSTAKYSLPFRFKGQDNCTPVGEQLDQNGRPNRTPTGEQHCAPVGERNCTPVGVQHLERESSEAASAAAPTSREVFQHHQGGHDDAVLTPYQQQVLDLLKQRTGTPRKLSRADRDLCCEWERQEISIVVVRRAIILGCLRKRGSVINSGGKAPTKINSLNYFSTVIAEAQDPASSTEYWNSREQKLKRVEAGIGLPEAAVA